MTNSLTGATARTLPTSKDDELVEQVERIFNGITRDTLRPEARKALAVDLAGVGGDASPSMLAAKADAIALERADCARTEPHLLEADGPWDQ